MKLEELSRNLTRLQFLQQLVDSGQIKSEDTKMELVDTLKTYRNVIALCWEHGEVSEAEAKALANLDRKLEALHQESRLTPSALK